MDHDGEPEEGSESMGLRFFLLVMLSIALLAAAVAGVLLIGRDDTSQGVPARSASTSDVNLL